MNPYRPPECWVSYPSGFRDFLGGVFLGALVSVGTMLLSGLILGVLL